MHRAVSPARPQGLAGGALQGAEHGEQLGAAPRRRRDRARPGDLPLEGYEIHQGHTPPGPAPLVSLERGPDGAIAGLTAGTYLHGFFDSPQVRAALVDKDRKPQWNPARVEDVDPAAIAAMFD